MAVPQVVGVRGVTGGQNAVNIAWPILHQPDDIALLIIETANELGTPDTVLSPGWTEFPDSPQGVGPAGLTLATRLTAYWKRATSTAEPDVTIVDAGNHAAACMINIRGCETSGAPYNVTAGLTEGVANTTCVIPGATTSIADCLVVAAVTHDRDTTSSNFSSWSSSGLAGFAEITNADGSINSGNGGGIGVAAGEKTTAGSFIAGSVVNAGSAVNAALVIAFKPAAVGPQTLTPPHLASSEQLYAPNILPGPMQIDLPHLASSEALYAPETFIVLPAEAGSFQARVSHVRTGATVRGGLGETWLTLPHLTSSEALYPPSVTQVAGSQTLTLPHLASSEALYPPTLTQQISLPHLASSQAFHPPTIIIGVWNLNLPHLASSESLYAPTVVKAAYILTLPHLASSEALYPPTVQPDLEQTLTLPHLASSEALYPPSISGGTLTLNAPHLASSEALSPPRVWPAPWPLTLPHLVSSQVFYAPSLGQVIVVAYLASSEQLYPPSLAAAEVEGRLIESNASSLNTAREHSSLTFRQG